MDWHLSIGTVDWIQRTMWWRYRDQRSESCIRIDCWWGWHFRTRTEYWTRGRLMMMMMIVIMTWTTTMCTNECHCTPSYKPTDRILLLRHFSCMCSSAMLSAIAVKVVMHSVYMVCWFAHDTGKQSTRLINASVLHVSTASVYPCKFKCLQLTKLTLCLMGLI